MITHRSLGGGPLGGGAGGAGLYACRGGVLTLRELLGIDGGGIGGVGMRIEACASPCGSPGPCIAAGC